MISFMQKLKSSGTAIHHHNNKAPTGRSRARGGGRPAGAAILASEEAEGRPLEGGGRPAGRSCHPITTSAPTNSSPPANSIPPAEEEQAAGQRSTA